MPKTYVVHLGNSQELTKAAEDPVARKLLRHHVRQSLGLHDNDVVFAMINSMCRDHRLLILLVKTLIWYYI